MVTPVVMKAVSSPERLLFIISLYSASNTNNAGHCYSLRELSSQFARAWPKSKIEILVLGDLEAGPLRDSKIPVTHISFKAIGPVEFVRRILKFGDAFAPTHVHSFDNKSHFFARWIANRTGAKTYLTKPGGPNPGRFFPFAPDIICFSEENLASLKPRPHLSQTRFHYFPQRVSTPAPDLERVAKLRDQVGPGDVLLRICRVGPYYERSIRQTFALAKELRARGGNIRAVLIGTIQSQETLDALQPLTAEGDLIINAAEFTHDAAALIPIATAVVGAGRSLIEAALLDKPVLTPVADSELPVLVTLENWRHLSATNFSERTLRPPNAADVWAILSSIKGTDRSANEAIKAAMSIDAAIPQYAELYASEQEPCTKTIDFLVNSASVTSKFIQSKIKASTIRRSPMNS
jgi:hypothetical protein